MDKTTRKIIKEIHIDKSNLEHIGKTGNINGTLLGGIENAMQQYANEVSRKEYKRGWNDGSQFVRDHQVKSKKSENDPYSE